MLNIKMEFNKGVFFIRLEGKLNSDTYKTFEHEVLPLLTIQGMKRVVINLDKLILLDKKGLKALIKIEKMIKKDNGIMSLCSITSKKVKDTLNNKLMHTFFEYSNELTAIGEMII